MAEYIAKNLAIELMHQSSYLSDGDLLEVNGKLAKARIEAEPAADVAPVVHGEWIPHSEKSREYIGTVLVHVMYDYWLCDTCGYRVENGQPMYNFCPSCGAKMNREREE